jgi:hypothetical protein
VKLAIPNNVATSLLDIPNGGIFQRNHGKQLSGKLQWPLRMQVLQPRRGLRFLLQIYATKSDRILSEVWLWHKRLGHLSFSYLKKLKPHLFTELQILDLNETFVNWQRAIVNLFLPLSIKALNLLWLFTLIFGDLQQSHLCLKFVTLLPLLMNALG